MTDGTCTVPGCERKRRARGWCSMHYHRWERHGSIDLPERVKLPCSIADCERIAYLKGMCRLHYDRLRAHGSTDKPVRPDKGCAVGGCEALHYCKGLCALHYGRQLRTGSFVTKPIEKLAEQQPCRICGEMPKGKTPSRQFCSAPCYHIWRAHGEEYVVARPCSDCGLEFTFLAITRHRRRRSDATRCLKCQSKRQSRWCMTVAELAARDDWICAIGGERVDPLLRWPDPGAATVDHIVPRSLGGADSPENMQLACARHNIMKSNKIA